MSTKSGHDLDAPASHHHHDKHQQHPHHHHSDGSKHHGGHHHGNKDGHHHGGGHHNNKDGHHGGGHHGNKDGHHDGGHHGNKHPPLRDATMKAGRGDGASSHGAGGGRPRAGTLTRRDTTHGKYPRSHHEHDRHSVGKHSESHVATHVEYENTYKLEPDARFKQTQIQEIIARVFKENLTDKVYDSRVMSRRCLELSDVIKEKVKQLEMHRFKIVCLVIVGQNTDQSMMVSSRCLWNFAYDNFASYTFKKEPYYAVGMVFATYTE